MKTRMKSFFGALCIGASIISVTIPVTDVFTSYAYADTIDDLVQNREDLKNRQQELEGQKQDKENDKKKTEDEIKSLEEELKGLIEEINVLDAELSELMVSIYENDTNLEGQIKIQDRQYLDMKLRIQYMYEDNNHSLQDVILGSTDMKDALNAANYFQNIYRYDRSRLDEIKETRTRIEEIRDELSDNLKDVTKKEEEMSEKRARIAALVAEKQEKLNLLDSDILATATAISDTERQRKENEINISNELAARAASLNSADTQTMVDFARKTRQSVEGYDENRSDNRVAELASTDSGHFPCVAGWCAAWVSGVYAAAGVTPPHGNAIDYWNRWQSSGGTNMTDVPVGACVISSGAGYDGVLYGHIGISIGGGLVASNVGYCKIETIESFAASATATCQGHTGYIGWVWPGGTPIV